MTARHPQKMPGHPPQLQRPYQVKRPRRAAPTRHFPQPGIRHLRPAPAFNANCVVFIEAQAFA